MKSASPEVLLVASLAIAMVPLLIAVGTCYLKFSIVLSLLRSGFGTQQAPSASLVMALSLVMSLVVMQPVISDTLRAVSNVQVAELGSLSVKEVSERGYAIATPWRAFLLAHSGQRELTIFHQLSQPSASAADRSVEATTVEREKVGVTTALAAFVLSEIKKGFTLAFFLLIPFFIIDLVVANLLVAMGLTMMSPVIVSLPIKILLFVTSDGWLLLARNLVQAYR